VKRCEQVQRAELARFEEYFVEVRRGRAAQVDPRGEGSRELEGGDAEPAEDLARGVAAGHDDPAYGGARGHRADDVRQGGRELGKVVGRQFPRVYDDAVSAGGISGNGVLWYVVRER
jgi:hypothetical protein